MLIADVFKTNEQLEAKMNRPPGSPPLPKPRKSLTLVKIEMAEILNSHDAEIGMKLLIETMKR